MITLSIKNLAGNERIKDFLGNKGYSVTDQVMENFNKIDLWKSWYKGYVPDFHTYKFYNGQKYINRTKKSMQMTKRICEDWANMLANEKIRFNVENASNQKQLDDWVKQNKFRSYLNRVVEKGMALGTSALVLTMKNMVAKGEKIDFTDAKNQLTIYEADQIYPLSYDDTDIRDCAFVSSNIVNGKTMVTIAVHHMDGKNYVVDTYNAENRNGTLVEESFFSVNTGSDRPLFAIFKPNINENQVAVPSGQSIVANAIDLLQGVDTIYDGFIDEFSLGRMRIFLDSELSRVDDDGNTRPAVDFSDGVYFALPKQFGDDKNDIHDFAPTLRTESFIMGMQENLNFLSTACGLGTGFYVVKNVGTAMTATAIYAGNQDLYRSTKKHEMNIEKVVRTILDAISVSTFEKLDITKDSLAVVFDDAIIENKAAEQTSDISQINAGVLGKVEYRMKWFGETEAEATAKIAKIQGETVQIV